MHARSIALASALFAAAFVASASAEAAPKGGGGSGKGGGGGSAGNWELEPHLNLAPYAGCLGGLGGRATVKLGNGAQGIANDSLGFTFGFDGVSCGIVGSGSFVAPVGVLWNFELDQDWSVFVDGGLMVPGPSLYVMGGGRYKVAKDIALTGRIGWPFVSFGVSFFL